MGAARGHPGGLDGARPSALDATALGRAGTVEDVAPLVVFLVSEESAWITGAETPVDGGQSAHGGAKAISDAVRATLPL